MLDFKKNLLSKNNRIAIENSYFPTKKQKYCLFSIQCLRKPTTLMALLKF